MRSSGTIAKIATALAAAQSAIPTVVKDAQGQIGNQRYKYADLPSVIDALNAVLAPNGLSYVQHPVSTPNDGSPVYIGVETLIMHSSGEWILGEPFYVPLNMQTAQGAGSAITYCRRYALCAAFGVSVDDDDASSASHGSGQWGGGQRQQDRRGDRQPEPKWGGGQRQQDRRGDRQPEPKRDPRFNWTTLDLAHAMEQHGRIVVGDFGRIVGADVNRENVVAVINELLNSNPNATIQTICAEAERLREKANEVTNDA